MRQEVRYAVECTMKGRDVWRPDSEFYDGWGYGRASGEAHEKILAKAVAFAEERAKFFPHLDYRVRVEERTFTTSIAFSTVG